MALTLIVEDGSNVAGANSYANAAYIAQYCAMRGVAVPADNDSLVVLAIKAMDYLESRESSLQGTRTYGLLQPLSWPRTKVRVAGTTLYQGYVPAAIVAIQCYLAGVAATIDLVGNQDTRAITEEQIGPIRTQYSASQGATVGPLLPQVDRMLQPFLRTGISSLRAVRV